MGVANIFAGAAVVWQVRRLSDGGRRAFFDLDSGLPLYIPVLAELRTFRRNAVSDEASGCLCALASLINHACTPNVCLYWNPMEGRHQVRALRPIQSGAELVASYVDLWQSTDARRRKLRRNLGFDCACGSCENLGEDDRRLSDH